MTMAATSPVDFKVAVTVERSVGKHEGAHPIKEAKGGHDNNNDNKGPPLYKYQSADGDRGGQVMQGEVKKIVGEGGE